MTTSRFRRFAANSVWLALSGLLLAGRADAQVWSQRGFVEGRLLLFPQEAPNDPSRVVGDVRAREDGFFKPAPWLQLAGGLEIRANSHDQVAGGWEVDLSDRGVRRARVTLRRAAATLARGRFTLDAGKQFIRWGKADIVNPTDRFAPRDFLNVVDSEFLAVTGLRGVVRLGDRDSIEAVWVPRLTPSRLPLLNQRWTVVPRDAARIPIVDVEADLPSGAQTGFRWSRVGDQLEYSLSVFDGFNHLPDIESVVRQTATGFAPEIAVRRVYPSIRAYGADAALPTRWFTLKGEMAYVTSDAPGTDEYALYVVQIERQTGEWALVGGYAGEAVTVRRAPLAFAPDRGLARSLVGRASYTLDANRSLAFEAALRQDGSGSYTKVEYSQARGQHWRATAGGAVIRGEPADFLGQYRLNSHLSLTLRYSF